MNSVSGPIKLEKINYGRLKPRQKESYNFHRVAARLAEYGYNSILLSDDWLGADFIAYHNDGETFYRVQLKGRMSIFKKYIDKGLYIAFIDENRVYVYPHDEMADRIDAAGRIANSPSWIKNRSYTWPSPPKWLRTILSEYEVL